MRWRVKVGASYGGSYVIVRIAKPFRHGIEVARIHGTARDLNEQIAAARARAQQQVVELNGPRRRKRL